MRANEANDQPADLFELLRTIRTRRVGYGYRVESGTSEAHPVTGRALQQPLGPRAFISQREPLPLTQEEEALLAWAGLGPNGVVAWEASLGAGFDQLTRVLGRTAPEPNNTLATDLVVINDHGSYLYRPEVTADDLPLPRKREEFLARVRDWYANGRVQLSSGRPDIDWAMRDPATPEAMLNGSHQYNLNRPGSTWFLPVTDAGSLQRGLPDLLARRRHYLVDDSTGEAAGMGEHVSSGKLVRPLPISAYEQNVLLNSAYPAGAIVQNIRLACEALGLGAWALSGYDQDILLGRRPDLSRGIGLMQRESPAVFAVTNAPSKLYKDGSAVVEMWRAERESAGGWLDESSLAGVRSGPFPASLLRQLAAHPQAHPPEWAWQATRDYIDYCIAVRGRWPVTYDAVLAHFSVIVHHVDTGYYERFSHPSHMQLTERIRAHEDLWHQGA